METLNERYDGIIPEPTFSNRELEAIQHIKNVKLDFNKFRETICRNWSYSDELSLITIQNDDFGY